MALRMRVDQVADWRALKRCIRLCQADCQQAAAETAPSFALLPGRLCPRCYHLWCC